jgi:hypothetical protein
MSAMRDTRSHESDARAGLDGEAPGSLPLDAFVSPLHARPTRPESNVHRYAAWMALGCALLTSVIGVAVALMARAGRQQEMPRVQRDVQVAAPPRAVHATGASGRTARLGPAAVRVSATSAAIRAGATTPAIPVSVQPAQPVIEARPSAPQKVRPRVKGNRPAAQKEPAARRAEGAPAVLAPKPTRAEVIAAMRRVTPAVNACFGKSHGTVRVAITVLGATGRVTTAKVAGRSGRVGSCIARAVRKARLPKFAQRKLEISYPFVR